MNEKTTSLSPNSSQNFLENQEEQDWEDKINKQIAADPVYFLPKVGEATPRHENPNWNQRKEEQKEIGKQTIQQIWAEHAEFLKNSGYLNPTKKSQILPQFFADKEKNLRLAQLFSIPIVKLRNQPYESRPRLGCQRYHRLRRHSLQTKIQEMDNE